MITAQNLTKRFGDKTAVSSLSFQLGSGEVLGFLGPNAAGKTTTMRMLTCYFPPSSGSATVAGFDIQKDSIKVRQQIGYLPENVPLYPEMTTREFIDFAASAKGVPAKSRAKEVERAIGRCNLSQVDDQLVGTLSRGFRQRVGLAQAIVNRPKVLILDEPTVGLDPEQIRDIRELIKSLSETTTVILSTHILQEVEALCNRIIIIAGGSIRAIDTVSNLNASLQGSNRIHLEIGKGKKEEILASLQQIQGVQACDSNLPGHYHVETSPGVDVRAELSRLVVAKEWDLLALNRQGLNLEDIFLRIVREAKSAEAASLPTPAAETAPEQTPAAATAVEAQPVEKEGQAE